LEQAVAQFQSSITREVAGYLLSRGITKEIAGKYRLGLVPEDTSSDWAEYRGRLAIPYLTRGGVVTVRFRGLDPGGPKYLSIHGDKPRLYSVDALFLPGPDLYIVEGEIDAITVNEHAGVPAVGVQGVSAWQDVFKRMVQDYDNVTVVGDGDQAGSDFARDLAKKLDARALVLPAGDDCNSILVRDGALALREALDA
jgi:DNA primase